MFCAMDNVNGREAPWLFRAQARTAKAEAPNATRAAAPEKASAEADDVLSALVEAGVSKASAFSSPWSREEDGEPTTYRSRRRTTRWTRRCRAIRSLD